MNNFLLRIEGIAYNLQVHRFRSFKTAIQLDFLTTSTKKSEILFISGIFNAVPFFLGNIFQDKKILLIFKINIQINFYRGLKEWERAYMLNWAQK